MCEPMHSVSQYATQEAIAPVVEKVLDDVKKEGGSDAVYELMRLHRLTGKQVLPDVGNIKAPFDLVGQWSAKDISEAKLERLLGKDVAKYMREVNNFHHVSRFGEGHSESRYSRLGDRQAKIPPPTCYEIAWWKRDVSFDGDLLIPSWLSGPKGRLTQRVLREYKKEALAACTEYAMRTSIGSLGTLRRFLEETIKTANIIQYYHDPIFDMFNCKGQTELLKRLAVAEVNIRGFDLGLDKKTRLIKVVCGLTRYREFMNQAWADVDSLWKPKKGGSDNAAM